MATLIYLSQNYSYYIRGNKSPLILRFLVGWSLGSNIDSMLDPCFVFSEIVLNLYHRILSASIVSAKGFCQVKIIQKIRKKLGLVRPHPPTPLSKVLYFFENILQNENNTENTKKHKISKKKKSSWGLTHLPTSEFFLDFWNYFNLTKPLSNIIVY